MTPEPLQRGDVSCLFVADIHLSLKPPVCRSGEKDWLRTQAGYLKQLHALSGAGLIPVVCAGDIFHRWDADRSPELINFAIEHLPVMWSVPGNHDLPNHRYEDVHKSAYWTLKEAGKVTDLRPGHEYGLWDPTLHLHGFPWGVPHEGRKITKSALVRDIAVVHEYVWTRGTGYKGAPEDRRLGAFRQRMGAKFDLIVTGDNHQPFYAPKGAPPVLNCGAFIRRRLDELNHRPAAWALLRDGSLEPHYLDTSKDEISDAHAVADRVLSPGVADELIDELRGDRQAVLSFEEAMLQHFESAGVGRRVRGVILEILEAVRKT